MHFQTEKSAALRTAAGLFLAIMISVPTAEAQIQGKIMTTEGKEIVGMIRWFPAGKKYAIASKVRDSVVNVELSADKVASIAVAKPQNLDAAIRAVKSGNAAAAIPHLEKIVKDYAMLQWDGPAASALAEAKLASGDVNGAIKICENLIDVKPALAYSGDIAAIYWQALLKADRTSKLEGLISKAVAEGDIASSASALIMRGDILMEKKKPLEALKDGYLRVILLYEGVRSVQPEALFKAAQAFEAMSQTQHAERMRGKLRTTYSKSEWAQKL